MFIILYNKFYNSTINYIIIEYLKFKRENIKMSV